MAYHISSGQSSNGIILNNNSMYISSGGTADSTTVSSGYMYISSGGTANNTTVNSSGYMYIDGGTANNTTINDGGDMTIWSGGTANNTTVNSRGSMYILSGGIANSTTVNDGNMYISSGGVANSTTVYSSGSMYISSGGTALEIVENGGYVDVADGANVTFASNTITGLTVYTSMTVHKNTIANNTTVNSSGWMYISSGGVANSTTVNSSGYMYIDGGTANNTTVNDGWMSISSGGVANSTTVNSGWMSISSGGVANNTTVNSDGKMYIYHSGKHTGSLQLESGAYLYVYHGCIIDFTVADRTVEDDYLMNNLSLIRGYATYTITVSTDQDFGTYKLAQGAESFTGSITICDGTINYGSITVNGDDFVYNDVTYSLDQVDGNLTLSVTEFIDNESPVLGDAPSVYIYDNYVEISWGEAYDNVGVAGYYVTVDDTVYTVTDLYLQVNDLAEGEHTYSIAAFDAAGNISESSDVYSFTIQSLISNDGNDSFETAVDFGEIFQDDITRHDISGAIEVAEDKDYYSFTLLETSNLKFFTDGAEGGDTIITLYNSDFEQIAYNDDSGAAGSYYSLLKAQLEAGTYYVVVNAYDVLDPYYLTIELNGSDGNDSFETAVDFGEIFQDDITNHELSGAIEVAEDKDYYSFTLLETSDLKIFTDGAPGGDTIITLYNSDFEEIAYDDDSGYSNYSLIETELQAGTYYVVVNTYNGRVLDSYYLTVELNESINTGDDNNSFETAVDLGEIFQDDMTIHDISGAIEVAEDKDYYSFTLLETSDLKIFTDGVESGDTIITLYNSDFEQIAYNDDSGAAGSYYSLLETKLEAGTYYVVVNAYRNSLISEYSLTVEYKKPLVLEDGSEIGVGNIAAVASGETINDVSIFGTLQVNGTVNNAILNNNGELHISNGGVANDTEFSSRGYMYISSGGIANNTSLKQYGVMYVASGGVANNTNMQNIGSMTVLDGGIAENTVLQNAYMFVNSGAEVKNTIINDWGEVYIYDGAEANDTIVNNEWGKLCVYSDGKANNTTLYEGRLILSAGIANNTTMNNAYMLIYSGAIASDTTLTSGGNISIGTDGIANNTVLNSGCSIFISSDGTHKGFLQIENGAVVSAYQGGIIDFTVADRTVEDAYLINNLSLITGTPTYTITVSVEQKYGTYKLAQGASGFSGSITIGDGTINYGSITVNGDDFVYNDVTYSLDQVDGNLALTIGTDKDIIPPVMPEISVNITELTTENVTVTATFAEDSVLNEYSFDGQKWFTYVDGVVFENNGKVYFRSTDASGNVSDYAEYVVDNIVEYAELNGDSSHLSWSKKNPGTTFVSLSDGHKNFEFATEGTSLDLFGLENGNYTWQVRSEHSQAVSGNAFEVKSSTEPQRFVSSENGAADLFIGRKNSVWLDKYKAVHNGFINGWTGTKEFASLAGKNNITDVFVGSEDANVLVLTDDANGDALFVEDIYSALGDQARFSQIDEIRAGAGDDIIDMTSQKFEYIGHGVKIYGGDGDDIIWANSGENILYGDVGNDRIVGGSGNDTIIGGIGNDSLHGGGGNDTFIFSGDFGNDVIEQLSGGSITLTFDSENVKWNELANAYTDGTNSVTINSDADVIVKYTSIA